MRPEWRGRVKSATRIRIGISACLLGCKVRYDGGDKKDPFIERVLGKHFDWVAVCPETEAGMAVPREPIRLERVEAGIRLVGPGSGTDYTDEMRAFARKRVAELAREKLGGFIFKADSPSCGVRRVRLHQDKGRVSRSATGVFAEELMNRLPGLPVEEEGRLANPDLLANWIERVFAYDDIGSLWGSRWNARDLIAFHTRYKLVLMAHSPAAYSRLGRIVGAAASMRRDELRARYEAEFMAALSRIATPGRHANVLQHAAGYFKRDLDEASRKDLLQSVEDYRRGEVQRIVPVTLILHHARRLKLDYLLGQEYLCGSAGPGPVFRYF